MLLALEILRTLLRKEPAVVVEGEVKEVLAMTDNDPQAAEGVGQETATPDPLLADAPKDDKDTDSLLDVFQTEEVEETTVSVLPRELSDVSIHSLLEQTRQVADEVKGGR